MLKTKKTEPRYLTETPVKDIVDKMLRTALHDQARELESKEGISWCDNGGIY